MVLFYGLMMDFFLLCMIIKVRAILCFQGPPGPPGPRGPAGPNGADVSFYTSCFSTCSYSKVFGLHCLTCHIHVVILILFFLRKYYFMPLVLIPSTTCVLIINILIESVQSFCLNCFYVCFSGTSRSTRWFG